MTTFHLGLALGRFIPPVAIAIAIGPRLARLATRPRGRSAVADGPPDLIVEDIDLPATAGSPGMRIRLYRPRTARGVVPSLVWVHGGRMVLGDHLQDERANVSIARPSASRSVLHERDRHGLGGARLPPRPCRPSSVPHRSLTVPSSW
ncbi:hypothetical protein DEJ25_14115 [Curtobacterium sp. MCPF17_011]|uniref:hypothetical protein n=1 Tax=Curtobacterium sp. MCPF17_011 TaxID=2175652 RepID=UPI000DA86990|nr:hypothetical protein [Curtobacterium sp. MCPF17_011]PZF09724.1 hypothetical protein DEJ25_14115 [Curtobacterium sp. MCPF17_011]